MTKVFCEWCGKNRFLIVGYETLDATCCAAEAQLANTSKSTA